MIDPATTYRFQRNTGVSVSTTSIMFPERVSLSLTDPKGRVTTELVTIGEQGPTIGRVRSTGHTITLREPDTITFLLPQAGRLDIRISDADYGLPAGRAMAFRPTERHTFARPDPASGSRAISLDRLVFAAATLQVPMARLRTLSGAAEPSIDAAFARDGTDLSGASGQFLLRMLPLLANDLFPPTPSPLPRRVAQEIEFVVDEQLYNLIGSIADRSASRRIFPAYHRVRQAEEIMHEFSDEPLSMLEIAATLGVSLRSLQLAFEEVHDGVSPRDRLTRIRLDRARRRLLDGAGGVSVTTVAMDCGFYHLGRFAQVYARTFGERPSETLARRRR